MRPAPLARYNSFRVISFSGEFTINSDLIRRWWDNTNPQNQLNKRWYIETYSLEQRRTFKNKWYRDMNRFKTEIEFFKWFEITGQLGSSRDSLQTLVTRWYTKEQTIDSITPPLEGLKIPYRKEIFAASPFKKVNSKDHPMATVADINKVIKKNNYTNQVLHVVSK